MLEIVPAVEVSFRAEAFGWKPTGTIVTEMRKKRDGISIVPMHAKYEGDDLWARHPRERGNFSTDIHIVATYNAAAMAKAMRRASFPKNTRVGGVYRTLCDFVVLACLKAQAKRKWCYGVPR